MRHTKTFKGVKENISPDFEKSPVTDNGNIKKRYPFEVLKKLNVLRAR